MRFMNDHPMTPVGIAKQIEIEKFKAQEALKQKELASRKRQPRKIKEQEPKEIDMMALKRKATINFDKNSVFMRRTNKSISSGDDDIASSILSP